MGILLHRLDRNVKLIRKLFLMIRATLIKGCRSAKDYE